MKYLIIIFCGFPIFCTAQIRTEQYTPTKTKYLELVEITDNLSGISKPIDSTNTYNRLDSLYYAFKLTPYPDQLKKYEIQCSLKVLLLRNSDIVKSTIYKISNDSGFLCLSIPSQFDIYTLKIYVNTRYKRRWRKSFKYYSDVVVYNEINRVFNQRTRNINSRGCGLSYKWPEEMLNYTRKNHSDYTPDQLIIRTVPGVN